MSQAVQHPSSLPAPPTHRRPVWTFTRHFLEMLVAMLVGMASLYPLWTLTVGATWGWAARIDVESIVMATAMVVPMALWMRHRGHATAPIVEMSAAMYAGYAIALPLWWLGTIGDHGVMMTSHVAMPALMLLAMAARWQEYAHPHPSPAAA